MNTLYARMGTLILVGLAGACALSAAVQEAPPAHPRIVVGTFDSRAITIAHVHSKAFQDELAGLHAELARAQAEGDTERAAELEAYGPELQEKLHRQGFGTAPVDDIVARIADRLPEVAREAGVDVIVSRWVLAYRAPAAETVDVTDALVALFGPDEATWKSVHEIVRQEPVPLDQLRDDD